MGWLLIPTALLVTIGGVAHMVPWIIGPATGLGEVAANGEMPSGLARENAAGAPTRILVLQAVGGSLFSLLFLFIPSVSTSYWILSVLTAQIIIIMYALIFAAVLRLRYTHPDVERPYRIPGGTAGVWIVAVRRPGRARRCRSCSGFIPPDQLKTGNPVIYVLGIAVGLAILALPPFLFRRRPPGQRGGHASPRPRRRWASDRDVTALAVLVALLSAALLRGRLGAPAAGRDRRARRGRPRRSAWSRGSCGRPIWLAGTAGDTLGYVAQAIALALGSLVLVQPLLATSLLFALPLGAWWAGRRLRRSDGVWALVLTAALGVFLVSGQPHRGRRPRRRSRTG